MIVYLLKNKVTREVWVGTSPTSGEERFAQLCGSMYLGIKEQIYRDLREHGVDAFTVEEYAVAEDREELKDMFEDAMDMFNGKSLIGVKTSLPKAPEPAAKRVVKKSTTTGSMVATRSPGAVTVKPVKDKIATGRTGSAAKEKLIKEKIALERAKMEAEKSKLVMEQAAEMRALMAAMDARKAPAKKR